MNISTIIKALPIARDELIKNGYAPEGIVLYAVNGALAALSAIDPETIRSEARAELIKKMRPIIDDMDCTCGGESEDSDHSYENSGCWKHDMMEILSAEPAPCQFYKKHGDSTNCDCDCEHCKPAQDDGKPEASLFVDWATLKKLAEEQFENRAKNAREGKAAAIKAGDTCEVQCFSCELQILNRGYDSWLMAYHLMRAAEVKRRIEGAPRG